MQKWNPIPYLQKNAKMESIKISEFYRLLLRWLQPCGVVLVRAYKKLVLENQYGNHPC